MTAFDQFRRKLSHVCDGFELMAAAAVGVGVAIAMSGAIRGIEVFWDNRVNPVAFNQYLTLIFNVVIGIEFMKMLCRPHTGNIIEILIFLMARHMVVKETTPLEDLLAVVSICLLFFFRRFMLATKPNLKDEVPGFYQLFARHWPGIFHENYHDDVDESIADDPEYKHRHDGDWNVEIK